MSSTILTMGILLLIGAMFAYFYTRISRIETIIKSIPANMSAIVHELEGGRGSRDNQTCSYGQHIDDDDDGDSDSDDGDSDSDDGDSDSESDTESLELHAPNMSDVTNYAAAINGFIHVAPSPPTGPDHTAETLDADEDDLTSTHDADNVHTVSIVKDEQDDKTDTTSQYKKNSVSQLKTILESHNISFDSKMKKGDMIALLDKHSSEVVNRE